MNIQELLGSARDAFTVKRVYGEPFERDGVTMVPAAAIGGGLGAGGPQNSADAGRTGGGFGLAARPVGMFVVRDGIVRWRPAIDANRVLGVVLMGIVLGGLVALRALSPRRVALLRRRSPRHAFRALLAR